MRLISDQTPMQTGHTFSTWSALVDIFLVFFFLTLLRDILSNSPELYFPIQMFRSRYVLCDEHKRDICEIQLMDTAQTFHEPIIIHDCFKILVIVSSHCLNVGIA